MVIDTNNIFDNPKKYLDIIRSTPCIPIDKQKRHDGKSMVVVFLTRFCKVGCTHCFCHSKPKLRTHLDVSEKDELFWEGCFKVVQFINSANVEYVLIAGGGEPFEKEELIYYIVEHCDVNRIVIATNGFWGRTYEKASHVVNKFKKIIKKKDGKLTLVLRLSLDQWHIERIGNHVIVNIINVFDQLIGEHSNFILELHTIEHDKSIDDIQLHFPNNCRKDGSNQVVSDGSKVLKNSKKRGVFTLESGLKIPIGFAKLFNPNLFVDLNCTEEEFQRITKSYYEDVFINQKGNYSVIYNDNGTKGLDYLINFNGNITTWGNYQLENISNIYVDGYRNILDNLYNDIISYSFLDKNLDFRENLIKPVNPSAVTRAAAINVRDYSGAYMLQEYHTALFYGICLIKHYIVEGLVDPSNLNHFPKVLSDVIHDEDQNIIKLYSQSNYSIIQQYMDDMSCMKDDWINLFKLIQLNHYSITDDQLKQGLEFFNTKYGTQYTEIRKVIQNIDTNSAISRFIEKMTFQQPAVTVRNQGTLPSSKDEPFLESELPH